GVHSRTSSRFCFSSFSSFFSPLLRSQVSFFIRILAIVTSQAHPSALFSHVISFGRSICGVSTSHGTYLRFMSRSFAFLSISTCHPVVIKYASASGKAYTSMNHRLCSFSHPPAAISFRFFLKRHFHSSICAGVRNPFSDRPRT